MGLSINEVTEGYSRVGAEEYLNTLNSKAITETSTKLRDINGIRTAIEKGWQGQAELNFMTNLQNAVEATSKGIEELKTILDGQFDAIEEAWANQDKDMVNLD